MKKYAFYKIPLALVVKGIFNFVKIFFHFFVKKFFSLKNKLYIYPIIKKQTKWRRR